MITRGTKIYNKAKEKLASSLLMKAYLDSYFSGSKLNIYKGVKKELQPDSSNYPAIAFSNITRIEAGDNISEEPYVVMIGGAIFDESDHNKTNTPSTPTTPEIDSNELPGRDKIEELSEIVKSEILDVKGLRSKISVVGEANFETVFPIFQFFMTFQFSFKKEMRSGNRR